MRSASVKRNVFRVLLVLHFIGLALTVGPRVADFVIDQQTSHADLQMLAFGQDLAGTIAKSLTAPGFWLIIATGVAMTLLRYGRRPPIWVWIKVGTTVVALIIAPAFVAPALQAGRQWAHWSADHNQLAPQFLQSTAQASFYGAIVFTLFLVNIPVAVWKPFLKTKLPILSKKREARETKAIVE